MGGGQLQQGDVSILLTDSCQQSLLPERREGRGVEMGLEKVKSIKKITFILQKKS